MIQYFYYPTRSSMLLRQNDNAVKKKIHNLKLVFEVTTNKNLRPVQFFLSIQDVFDSTCHFTFAAEIEKAYGAQQNL